MIATAGRKRAQFSALIRPFVPDAHAMFLQIPDVRIAGQKPQQLMDDRFQMQLLGRDQGKPSSSANRIW
jgi:hypothetical protein